MSLRIEGQALATAARYDCSKTADDIVKDAEKYFTFLQGNSSTEPADKVS